MAKFQEQRERHLANIEDALYRQLFESEGERRGEYRPYSFTRWLDEARNLNNGDDILRNYEFSPEELHLRKANNPFASGTESLLNKWGNQAMRMQGHGMLNYGYTEGLHNNRQFPDEYKNYMNPYEDEVVKKVIEDMRGEKQAGLDAVSADFTKAGSHGSQIQKPNAVNKYDRAMEKMIMGEAAKLRSQGYQQAAQIFNADRLAREQNIASRMQVPFGMQRFERGQLGTLENLNNARVHDRQQALNAAHGRFREQHDQPFNDVSNLHSIFSQGGGYRPSGNYYEAQNPSNYFQESKTGGKISFKEMARQLAEKGRKGDTELAHINPVEAAVLKSIGGSGTTNPNTGLKEYSFFTNPGKAIRGLGKKNRLLAETAGLAGALFGGPLGGALGGAAKAALLKQKILPAALKGGVYGYAVPAIAGMAGNALGSESGVGKFLGDYASKNAGNFGSIGTKFLGMEDSPNFINKMAGINPHGQKLPTAEHNPFKVIENSGGEKSFMDRMMGADKGYLDYAAAFAPAAIQGIGMSSARKDAKTERADSLRREQEQREMLMRQVAYEEAKEAKREGQENELSLLNKPLEDERRAFEIAKMKREQEKFKRQSSLEEKMQKEKEEREKERIAKELEQERYLEGLKAVKRERPILAFDGGGRVACFKEGGRVALGTKAVKFARGGYVEGSASGVKDNVRADLPEGAYVLDATTVSLLGDGNSKAGSKKIDDFLNAKRMEDRDTIDTLVVPAVKEAKMKKRLASGGELAKVAGRIVPAKISNGEYVLSPEDVLLFSRGGSLSEGAKALDRMRERLKAQKGVKTGGILPPTKPIEMYLNGSY